ncbi:MAG: 1-acyl-sn-glycerol-3-phosphate acyltransferase [Saprospiraceae bacterium]
MKKKRRETYSPYSPVFPNIEDWPIYKLSQDRRNFVQDLAGFTFKKLLKQNGPRIADVIAKTIYLERIRIKEEPWKVDPPNERQFWKKLQDRLVKRSLDKTEEEAIKVNEELLGKIIQRYAEEIVGTFKKKTFLFAQRFLYLFFTRLLNTAAGRNFKRIYGRKHRLIDRLIVEGEVEAIRSLMQKGTVVVVPTHFSNLDSILIGYALDAFAGLPSFSYGAGLNLYNTGYTAYFMNRLGAYRVDRRKKNAIYLETLKAMSNLSLQRGVNSLFFPGGTRSRSGELETKVKLGLLGTVVEAQRAILEKGDERKIFVVPLVLSYHFVLEGQFLIEQHLRQIGKEHYIRVKDKFKSSRSIFKFIWQLFSTGNSITISIGKPMDVMGNLVDNEGNSSDQFGNPIAIKDYFSRQGELVADLQRESEYTKMLGDRIVDRFHKDNIVLNSHLVAFAAFQIIKNQNTHLDLYGILRLPTDDYIFNPKLLKEVLTQLIKILMAMEERGDIKLSEAIHGDLEEWLKDGVKRLGNFHVVKPLRLNKRGEIVSDSFKLLYFYHNRMASYHLEKQIDWKKVSLEEILEV